MNVLTTSKRKRLEGMNVSFEAGEAWFLLTSNDRIDQSTVATSAKKISLDILFDTFFDVSADILI